MRAGLGPRTRAPAGRVAQKRAATYPRSFSPVNAIFCAGSPKTGPGFRDGLPRRRLWAWEGNDTFPCMSNFPDPSDPSATWGAPELREGVVSSRGIGSLTLWFLLRDGELHLAVDPSREGTERSSSPPPGGLEWRRWALPGPEPRLRLRPALPNRPIVIETGTPLTLLPRAQARIFVRVPLWIQIELLEDGQALILEEIPTVQLSDTWWGDQTSGELCYFQSTQARRVFSEELLTDHLAVCPLLLVNRSTLSLPVDKFSFQAPHLSLFGSRGGFWADESVVHFQDETEGVRVEITGRPPAEAQDPVRISEPRSPMSRGFSARTFQRLRMFPGLGGEGA